MLALGNCAAGHWYFRQPMGVGGWRTLDLYLLQSNVRTFNENCRQTTLLQSSKKKGLPSRNVCLCFGAIKIRNMLSLVATQAVQQLWYPLHNNRYSYHFQTNTTSGCDPNHTNWPFTIATPTIKPQHGHFPLVRPLAPKRLLWYDPTRWETTTQSRSCLG